MDESYSNILLEISNKIAILENSITERGGSEVLYHFTDLDSLISMIRSGNMTAPEPNSTDKKIGEREGQRGKANPSENDIFTNYISFTRMYNNQWGYPRAKSGAAFHRTMDKDNFDVGNIKVNDSARDGVDKVRVTFNGRLLSQGNIIRAIDFFGANPYKSPALKWAGDDSIKRSILKQQEDRLFLKQEYFPQFYKFVDRIDVLVNPKNAAQKNKAAEILKLAQENSQYNLYDKIHIYGDIQSFNRISVDKETLKSKGIDYSQWRGDITKYFETDDVSTPPNITQFEIGTIAKTIWCILFLEKQLSVVLEENFNILKELPVFNDADVKREIKNALAAASDYAKKNWGSVIFEAFKNLSNEDIFRFVVNGNPKIKSMDGDVRPIGTLLLTRLTKIANKVYGKIGGFIKYKMKNSTDKSALGLIRAILSFNFSDLIGNVKELIKREKEERHNCGDIKRGRTKSNLVIGGFKPKYQRKKGRSADTSLEFPFRYMGKDFGLVSSLSDVFKKAEQLLPNGYNKNGLTQTFYLLKRQNKKASEEPSYSLTENDIKTMVEESVISILNRICLD